MKWSRYSTLLLIIVSTLFSSGCATKFFTFKPQSVLLFISEPEVGITQRKINYQTGEYVSTTVLVPSTSAAPRPQGVSAAYLAGKLWIAWNESDRSIKVCQAPCTDPNEQYVVENTSYGSFTSPSLLSINGELLISWAFKDHLKFASSSDGMTWTTFKNNTYDQEVGPTDMVVHNGHIFAAVGFYQPMVPPPNYGDLEECPREIMLMRIEVGSQLSHGEFRVPITGCSAETRNGVSVASDGSRLTVGFVRRGYSWLIRSDVTDGEIVTWSLPARQLHTGWDVEIEDEHRINLAPVIVHRVYTPSTLAAINMYIDDWTAYTRVVIHEIGNGGELGAYWSGPYLIHRRVYGVDLKIRRSLLLKPFPTKVMPIP